MNISMLLNPGFSFFGIWDVKWYGVIMACAMVVGIIVAIFTCKAKGYDKAIILDLAIAALPLALIGARLYYCIFYGVDTFWDIFKVWEGGMAIYGGVIGGVIGVVIVSLVKKIPFLDLCDIAAPCLILGQAIGRWGNFVNQEAYGALITDPNLQWFPFGVYIDSNNFTSAAQSQVLQAFGSLTRVEGAWFNATFFYESFWNIIGFVILMIICHKVKLSGVTTACYFIYYGIGRAAIEGFRTDSLYLWGTGIRVSQALSILLIIGGVILLTAVIVYYKKHPQQALATNNNQTTQQPMEQQPQPVEEVVEATPQPQPKQTQINTQQQQTKQSNLEDSSTIASVDNKTVATQTSLKSTNNTNSSTKTTKATTKTATKPITSKQKPNKQSTNKKSTKK